MLLTILQVTEYAQRGDLGNVIEKAKARNKKLKEEEVWAYFVQICNGLDALHAKKILHRDLKPKNIFLTASNELCLGDLGCSKVMKSGMARTQVGELQYCILVREVYEVFLLQVLLIT